MSENPTSLFRGAMGVAAVVTALALPASALADKDKDKGKAKDDKAVPAACADVKQSKHPHGGPPGLTKKADAVPECRDIDEQAPAPAPAAAPVAAAAPAPAAAPAAPVVATANSLGGKCEKRKSFRITLHKGRVKTARVMLNGRAISVTRGKKKTSVLIDMRGRKNQNFVVRHTVVTKGGKLKTGTRRFRTCG